MALSKAYGNIVEWAVVTVVIFAVLIFGGVFIGKTDEVGQSIIPGLDAGSNATRDNISALTQDYFTASGELSTVVITVISFVILAALLILLYYFVRGLRATGGKGGDGPKDLI